MSLKWSMKKSSELEGHKKFVENPNAVEDNIPLSQCNDQEGSTLDGNSKTSIPDILSLTIRDDQYVEATRIHLEAYSRVTNPTTHILGEGQPLGQVASRDGSAIRADKQATDGKHAEMMLDGTQNTKVVKK